LTIPTIRVSWFANLIVAVAFHLLFGSFIAVAQSGSRQKQKPVAVVDAIGMTRFADDYYFKGGAAAGRVAHFSPDGKQFTITLRKGNLEQNTNEFSLLLFHTADALRSPKPEVLLTKSSSSNRDAIKNVSWLEDSETVAFIGENPGEVPQVYTFNVSTKQLIRVTNHSTPVVNYAISPNGNKVFFAADPPRTRFVDTEEARRAGISVTTQSLDRILSGDCYTYRPSLGEGEELFFKVKNGTEKPVPALDLIWENSLFSLSPDGQYVAFTAMVRDVPESWIAYQDKQIHEFVAERRPKGLASYVSRYMLFDVERAETKPLLDVPDQGAHLGWKPDSQGVVITKTLLPLEGANPKETEARKRNTYTVEVRLPSREIIKLADKDSPNEKPASSRPDVVLEENMNLPPRIYAIDEKTKQKALLLDLNPEFAGLSFGKVESITWKAADGHEVEGGLYLPPDFDSHKRYPLVIQTHGFNADKFWIDGPWSSAFAAQPLASAGIVVLQVGRSANRDDGTYTLTTQEAPREMAAYEGAIDELDRRGLIDRNRVGIAGFSRTVFTVGYTLTHSKYYFSAATLVDGIDGGYFQYFAFSNSAVAFSTEFDQLNGGPPFGENLAMWLKSAADFNLDRIDTPLRLVALGPSSVLLLWEWFSGLSRLEKPVDFIYLPDAPHLIVKPWDRVIAQQGLVDWFRFWLMGEQDPDPAKADQYKRWRELRRLQAENDAKDKAAKEPAVVN
jgi:dipeptidyl aminopeptidase/acylaminoacyl peptidase